MRDLVPVPGLEIQVVLMVMPIATRPYFLKILWGWTYFMSSVLLLPDAGANSWKVKFCFLTEVAS